MSDSSWGDKTKTCYCALEGYLTYVIWPTLSSGSVHTESETRSVCKQKREYGEEEPISGMTVDIQS